MNKEELTPCKGLPGWYCNEDGEVIREKEKRGFIL